MTSLTEIAFNKVIKEGQGRDVINDIRYKMMSTESRCLVINDILEREGFNKKTIEQIENLNVHPEDIVHCIMDNPDIEADAILYYLELYDPDYEDVQDIFNRFHKNENVKAMVNMYKKFYNILDDMYLYVNYQRWNFNLRIIYSEWDIKYPQQQTKDYVSVELENLFVDIVRHINYICKDMNKKCLDREFKNVEKAMQYIYETYEKYNLEGPPIDFFSLEKAVGNPDYYKNYMKLYNKKTPSKSYSYRPPYTLRSIMYNLVLSDRVYNYMSNKSGPIVG